MAKHYEECLTRFNLPHFDPDWGMIRRGIEKESLRVAPNGMISKGAHPAALGSALTNPFITTDFSEALLEFITPAYASIDECLAVLENVHRFTARGLENDEMFWVTSMPCPMDEQDIPLARYGNSNVGKLKTLYRSGLSNRYGSIMQAIAGIHYNFSMPDSFWPAYQDICQDSGDLQDFKTEKYLHLIRNFHRYSWLLIYLFGASPAACKCFTQGREHDLQEFDSKTLFLPDATCLRMGNLGYKSEAQKSLFVCYNELDSYVECLSEAMQTPFHEYQKIGSGPNGEPLQINSNLLQLENEFYSTIRPKRVAEKGERPLQALMRGGIEYIEVRALDLNPFTPLGIDAEQIRFLDSFLLFCLLSESVECHKAEFFEVADNIARVVEGGRKTSLQLSRDGQQISLKNWADSLLDDIENSSSILDSVHKTTAYSESLSTQRARINNPDLTPSGQMLNIMREQNQSFFDFSLQQSQRHYAYFVDNPLSADVFNEMQKTAAESLVEQSAIERASTQSFEDFLREWNSFKIQT